MYVYIASEKSWRRFAGFATSSRELGCSRQQKETKRIFVEEERREGKEKNPRRNGQEYAATGTRRAKVGRDLACCEDGWSFNEVCQ